VSVITFTRVGKEDTPQEWGIRGPREQLVPGSTVTATRLDGSVFDVVVGPMIRSNEKTGISIHHIQPAAPAKAKKKYWSAITVSEKREVINKVLTQSFQNGEPFAAEHVASKIRTNYAHLYYLTRGLTMGIGQMLASNKDFLSERPEGAKLKLWRYVPLTEEQPEDEKQRIQAVIAAGVTVAGDVFPKEIIAGSIVSHRYGTHLGVVIQRERDDRLLVFANGATQHYMVPAYVQHLGPTPNPIAFNHGKYDECFVAPKGIDLLPCRDCGVKYPNQAPWFPEASIGEDLCVNCQPKMLEPAVGAKHWAEMVLYRLENYLMDKSQEARVLQADADEMKDYYKGRKVQSKEAATMLRHFRKIELELAEKQEALRQESLGRERKS